MLMPFVGATCSRESSATLSLLLFATASRSYKDLQQLNVNHVLGTNHLLTFQYHLERYSMSYKLSSCHPELDLASDGYWVRLRS